MRRQGAALHPDRRPGRARGSTRWRREAAAGQRLTIVRSSAQLERCVWDSGCAQGWCSPC